MMHLRFDTLPSPIGSIALVTDDDGRLRALDFHDYDARMRRLLRLHYGTVELAEGRASQRITDALRAYFAGDHAALADVEVATAGTLFQRRVWAALRDIPAGQTVSYGTIAAAIGAPGASRAVGAANGANPVAIVVPCHRVIGANSTLTGFGGGLHRKQWLLEHEGVSVFAHQARKQATLFA